MKVSRVQEMRTFDQRALSRYGIPEELLMENAGEAAYFVILNKLKLKGTKYLIICGIGNNGGDGLVVARKLHSIGSQVTVVILGDPARYKGAARLNFEIVSKLPIKIIVTTELARILAEMATTETIIDAIFGTGLDRPVTDLFYAVIEQINRFSGPVVSLDIPSGINGDTGQMLGIAVKADATITFGLPKIGNLLYPGFAHGGKLFVSHISFPPLLYTETPLKIATNEPPPLPPRARDAHKGNCGKVLFIAGAARYYGAPYFSALSFLKAGGGLSFLATPENVAPVIASHGAEIVLVPQAATTTGSIRLSNKSQLLDFIQNVDFVVIGPGLSLEPETQQLVRELAAVIPKPLLIDGDGLTAIAADLSTIQSRRAPTILTPHTGEMAHLLQKDIHEISTSRIDLLEQTTTALRAIIVLKGAHSLIGYPDGRIFINLSGNPGMATAGSGDVLTGTIAAAFGLGLKVEDAVAAGVFLHGFAGDLAAQRLGEDGLLARDIMQALPQAVRLYREKKHAILANAYHSIQVI
ncbi:NAD(P)H-hydrate dehydratase [candidate division KSB1 bacterium]|nr:NAD(P)H-hydrate dehydratase [candidate division KSB1 bacterium]